MLIEAMGMSNGSEVVIVVHRLLTVVRSISARTLGGGTEPVARGRAGKAPRKSTMIVVVVVDIGYLYGH